MLRRLFDLMDDFPPGRVPLLLILFTVVSGGLILVRGDSNQQYDLTVWTFTHVGYAEFEKRLDTLPGGDRVHLVNLGRASTDRLALAVMTGTDLPDLVEIEQSEIGNYLRGPMEDIPFVDLTDRIHDEGWDKKCIASRFLKYSRQGRIFGLPHDLHPMVLVYRPDVMAELGVDPEKLKLWDDWKAVADKFYRPGKPGTDEWRYGMGLTTVEAFDYLMLLWQRGGDIFGENDEVIIDNDLAVDTLEKFVALFEGETPLVGSKLGSWSEDFAALADGQFVAMIAPDWMLATMRMDAGELLSGKLRCMPLPAWEPGGRRTSTLGGTMMAIPKATENVDAAWEMAKKLYFDREGLVQRFRAQTIIPPLRTAYEDPAFDEPVEFFGGQRVGRLLTELADEIPPVRGASHSPLAFSLLNAVFSDVIAGRVSPREALEGVAAELRTAMQRDRLTISAAKAEKQGANNEQ